MNFLYRIGLFLTFLAIAILIIAYARGYRIDFKKKSFKSTGIISVSSNPKAAKIFVNNELKGVTDTNVSLPPGDYQIDIKKEGHTSYSKKITLKGELVMTVDALLFPSNPSLSPLTNLGIVKAIPIDQTDKIIIFVDNKTSTQSANEETKNGIYLFEANRKPLNILSPLKLLLSKNLLPKDYDFIPTSVTFSPDFKQVIFEFNISESKKPTAFLLSLEEVNNTLFDITASKQKLTEAWDKEKMKNQLKILETFPKEITKVASSSFKIISFSPNENKFLYKTNKPILLPPGITPPIIAANQTKEERSLVQNRYYVYDKKEDKNYNISSYLSKETLDNDELVTWYFDSKHLLVNEKKRIAIMDYDGNNKQTVYSAAFENDFITTTSDGNLIVLANLNPEANLYPDLYAVGIK